MAQTLVKIYIHVVFSTKNRDGLILPEIEKELFAYIGGILRKHNSILIAADGTTNHVHLLISQSKNISLSDLLRELKKASSLWIKTKNSVFKNFQWQAGFGAFSIGQSQVETVKNYIARQKEHHRTELFENEYRKFLQKYEIDFDEEYFLD
jgi:REP element-mobilizing transposase RayT